MNPEEIRIDETEETPLDPPKFAVTTVLNVQTQKEASEAVAPKSAKIISYACIAALVLSIGLLTWQYIVTGSSGNLLLLVVAALVGLYLIYSHLTMPKKALRRWEENMIRNFGSATLHLEAEFYNLNMVQTLRENTDNITVEGYSELRGMIESEHMFLLKRNRQQWFFIAKDGFTTGTADEFRKFITERIGGK